LINIDRDIQCEKVACVNFIDDNTVMYCMNSKFEFEYHNDIRDTARLYESNRGIKDTYRHYEKIEIKEIL
jgi:hypothetical protein